MAPTHTTRDRTRHSNQTSARFPDAWGVARTARRSGRAQVAGPRPTPPAHSVRVDPPPGRSMIHRPRARAANLREQAFQAPRRPAPAPRA